MAFTPKTDWIGLEDGTNLKLKSNSDGASSSNLEIVGKNGDLICNQIYGQIKAPTCEYVICKDTTVQFDLGVAHNTTYPTFALQSYTISTGAGQEPTFNATAVQIEANSNNSTYCTYTPTQMSISPARHALDFGVLKNTWVQSCSLTLQNSTYTATCGIDPSTINGDPVASDAVQGKETVELTFWTNTDLTSPDVEVADGWRQTSEWTCTGADSSMFTWTATFEKYLTSTEA